MDHIEVYNVGEVPIAKEKKPLSCGEKRIPISDLKNDLPIYLFLGVMAIFTVISFIALDLEWTKILERVPKLFGVFLELAKFSGEKFDLTVLTLAETISVTILATVYGVLAGLMVGFFGAKNTTPWKPLAGLIQCILSFIRAVPTAVWVLLVLASMGFGMEAGVVGLFFHVLAFFGKVFAESFEEVSDDVIEALKATGANRIQVFFGAVLPTSLTNLIAWIALRFETNYIEAAILGMVGAGGIGYTIMAAMNSYQLGRAGLAIVIVFIFAYAVELVTSMIKRKMKV